jgi:hypothetical protein
MILRERIIRSASLCAEQMDELSIRVHATTSRAVAQLQLTRLARGAEWQIGGGIRRSEGDEKWNGAGGSDDGWRSWNAISVYCPNRRGQSVDRWIPWRLLKRLPLQRAVGGRSGCSNSEAHGKAGGLDRVRQATRDQQEDGAKNSGSWTC